MNAVWTIAWAGFTEARRNRVTVVIAAFTLILILSTTVILNMTVFTLDRVATDFGLGVMSLLLVGLAIFLSSGQLSREIERRTVFLVLSRPVSRGQFVIGRVLGTLITLWTLQAFMSLTFLIQLAVLNVPVTSSQGAALVGLAAELTLLCVLGALLSSCTGPVVASLSAVGLYLIGHGASDLYILAQHSQSRLVQVLGEGLYWIVPQLDRLDFKLQASYGVAVSASQLGVPLVYTLGYSSIALILAILIFERTDFK